MTNTGPVRCLMVLYVQIWQKIQKEMTLITNSKLPCMVLLGVNFNHIKKKFLQSLTQLSFINTAKRRAHKSTAVVVHEALFILSIIRDPSSSDAASSVELVLTWKSPPSIKGQCDLFIRNSFKSPVSAIFTSHIESNATWFTAQCVTHFALRTFFIDACNPLHVCLAQWPIIHVFYFTATWKFRK